MSRTTAAPTAPWFEHLVDSVRALGEAAHEWQIADQQTRLLQANVQIERRVLHEGKITGQPGAGTRGWESRRTSREPHPDAVFALQKIYLDLGFTTRRRYEDAAMLYASGAAWAIARVQAGETPTRVTFALDAERLLVPGPCAVDGLGRYAEAGRIAAAYERLISLQIAGDHAEELAGRDYIADHEASEMFDAAQAAEGLADAAYAFGLLAERAVGYVLLEPRRKHGEELARVREAAGAETGQQPGGDQ
jgi:hypothetical protein